MRCSFAAALLLLLSAGTALAAPAERGAVFARSCSECPAYHFCEFAYPGAPADSIACVPTARRHELYRRYDSPACTDTDALGKGATVKCPSGAQEWQGCDASSGAISPAGAGSAKGACTSGTGTNLCCVPASGIVGMCGGDKYCVVGDEIALTITDFSPRTCIVATGETGNTGTGNCQQMIAGRAAGCCFAS
ncbi:hypothetical protein DFJ74DRAFT_758587 [Hyaloraphidium curvatum]|nr:hypothetical protein DFJ74DRAFT_758587 [Hyaloraphidium curvatum]